MSARQQYRLRARIVIGAALMSGTVPAQAPAGPNPSINLGPNSAGLYVTESLLPSIVKGYLKAVGPRLKTPGQERTILNGTYSDAAGSTGARLVWEAPGNLRFDRANKPGQALIYSTAAGLVGPAISAADSNLLESLLDDAVELFLYGYRSNYAHRFLGGLFRANNVSSGNYPGPWYEIHQTTGAIHAQRGIVRTKDYYFDSATKLLAKTLYTSGSTRVVTEFNNWITAAGQRYPGAVLRIEDGAQVGAFTITSAATGPSVNDGLFSGRN